VPAVDQSALGQRGFFYVGGKYVGEPGKEIMQGQAYVEVLAPKDVRRPYPLVLIHGAGVTATYWMGTPDGRKGWADYFVEQGYIVYLMEQPMRGRSAVHPADGPTRMFTVRDEEILFTATATEGTWPCGARIRFPERRADRASGAWNCPRDRRRSGMARGRFRCAP